ncbi:hypothetical protein FRC03_007717 [Tulasnella sp. 419]|nr:hypothetical protein FRC02_004826 [Tulasnella sp. 418]KAG8937976.1 hypothetical protein FRC03_007717 [Tulasnella sp. 419]
MGRHVESESDHGKPFTSRERELVLQLGITPSIVGFGLSTASTLLSESRVFTSHPNHVRHHLVKVSSTASIPPFLAYPRLIILVKRKSNTPYVSLHEIGDASDGGSRFTPGMVE